MKETALIRREPPGDEHGLAAIRDGIARLGPTTGSFLFSHGEEISGSANQYLWFGPRAGDEIAVVDDFTLAVRYVAVRAASETRAAELADALGAVVEHVSLAELHARASECEGDPPALMRLALALTSFDPEANALIARALGSRSTATRGHAVMAAALLRWPELLPELRVLAASEQDEAVLRLAHHAVHACSPSPSA